HASTCEVQNSVSPSMLALLKIETASMRKSGLGHKAVVHGALTFFRLSAPSTWQVRDRFPGHHGNRTAFLIAEA
ncbi:hypothetical protein, partial [Massilia mucilaginosa]|uniref:hypothetical protein n=1 Tax=Massilia mucilaginosa TaxID=2609282 RepID=UPI001CB6BC5A